MSDDVPLMKNAYSNHNNVPNGKQQLAPRLDEDDDGLPVYEVTGGTPHSAGNHMPSAPNHTPPQVPPASAPMEEDDSPVSVSEPSARASVHKDHPSDESLNRLTQAIEDELNDLSTNIEQDNRSTRSNRSADNNRGNTLNLREEDMRIPPPFEIQHEPQDSLV